MSQFLVMQLPDGGDRLMVHLAANSLLPSQDKVLPAQAFGFWSTQHTAYYLMVCWPCCHLEEAKAHMYCDMLAIKEAPAVHSRLGTKLALAENKAVDLVKRPPNPKQVVAILHLSCTAFPEMGQEEQPTNHMGPLE